MEETARASSSQTLKSSTEFMPKLVSQSYGTGQNARMLSTELNLFFFFLENKNLFSPSSSQVLDFLPTTRKPESKRSLSHFKGAHTAGALVFPYAVMSIPIMIMAYSLANLNLQLKPLRRTSTSGLDHSESSEKPLLTFRVYTRYTQHFRLGFTTG